MNSVWTKDMDLPRFQPLKGDLRTDVLIIGGGMAGILCAYQLAREGVDYALVEARFIGEGITKNTTAKITSQHGLIYDRLIKRFGLETARLYLQANQAALDKYRELSQDMDCDFEEKDALVYSLDGAEKLQREAAALERLGSAASFQPELPLPFPVAGAVWLPHQADRKSVV